MLPLVSLRAYSISSRHFIYMPPFQLLRRDVFAMLTLLRVNDIHITYTACCTRAWSSSLSYTRQRLVLLFLGHFAGAGLGLLNESPLHISRLFTYFDAFI